MRALAKQKHFRFGKVYSQTSKLNDDYDYLDKKHIEIWDEEKARAYIKEIEDWAEKNGNKNLPNNFLILDDLLAVMDPYSNFLQHLYSIHRQLKLTIFITSQYLAKNISTQLRSICHHAFIFPVEDMPSHKLLYSAFGSLYFKFEEFQQLVKKANDIDHRCLLFTRGTKGNDVGKAFVFYRAPTVTKFRIKL